MFQPVTREQNKLRLAICGVAGAGKTYTALRLAHIMAGENGRIALIDTEHGRSKKYEGEAPDGRPWKWDGCDLEHFAPSTYEQAIRFAGSSGYSVLIIDSLSHAWAGVGGALEQKDKAATKVGKNAFTAWSEVTPEHNRFVDSLLASNCHVIGTIRSKMEHVIDVDAQGKKVVRKLGLKPIFRDGVEFEFDFVCDMDLENRLTVAKTSCPDLLNGTEFSKPGREFIEPIMRWLLTGKKRQDPPLVAAAVPQSSAGVALDTARRSSDALAEDIKSLAKDLGWSLEKLREVLARAGAARVKDLLEEHAVTLRNRMRAKLLEVQSKAAFA